jgi:orotidine-5'-phosphate decarboxylase
MIIDRLIDKIIEKNNPTTVGLDTAFSYLPEKMQKKCKTLGDVAKAIYEFNCNIIDEIYEIVPSVKVQVAYYEMYGYKGLKAFYKTVEYAKSKGLVVISDIKRNDIGSTAQCYSNAYLGKVDINGKLFSAFPTDFVTVNGYLGSDGIIPFTNDCKQYNKGMFILVKTSNPASAELQNKKFQSGETLFEAMGDLVSDWGKDLIGKYGFSSIGAVVGATHKQEAETIRKRLANVFFLIPGYGAQGGKAKDLVVSFNEKGIGGIVNSSRGIICAYKQDKYKGLDYAKAARAAALDMKQDIISALEECGKSMVKG